MTLALALLREVLPGKGDPRFFASRHDVQVEYRWPCGCRARGSRRDSLRVTSCASHREALRWARSRRAGKS